MSLSHGLTFSGVVARGLKRLGAGSCNFPKDICKFQSGEMRVLKISVLPINFLQIGGGGSSVRKFFFVRTFSDYMREGNAPSVPYHDANAHVAQNRKSCGLLSAPKKLGDLTHCQSLVAHGGD